MYLSFPRIPYLLLSEPSLNAVVASKSYDTIPYSKQVDPFIGRKDILRDLEDRCSPPIEKSARPQKIVLQALGGQGKTQVVLELARRMQSLFSGLFWVNASTTLTAEKDFNLIAHKLNINTSPSQNESAVDAVARVLKDWDDKWMLIFDNYDDLSLDIRKFFPSCE
jgi:hypothetical protein